MKFYQKLFLVVIVSFFMLSFTGIKKTEYKIKITKSSKELNVAEFILKEGKTQLYSKNGEMFYVKVKSKPIKGKTVNNNFTKTKRKGIEYKVTYIYEYESGLGKHQKFNQKYYVWDDGEIQVLSKPEKINVGKMSLKTELK